MQKFLFTIKPGIDENPEKCPTFRTTKDVFKLIDKLKTKYEFEFVFIHAEPLRSKRTVRSKGR